jgi:hypothetical protein
LRKKKMAALSPAKPSWNNTIKSKKEDAWGISPRQSYVPKKPTANRFSQATKPYQPQAR